MKGSFRPQKPPYYVGHLKEAADVEADEASAADVDDANLTWVAQISTAYLERWENKSKTN